jgi:hypothetical protein
MLYTIAVAAAIAAVGAPDAAMPLDWRGRIEADHSIDREPLLRLREAGPKQDPWKEICVVCNRHGPTNIPAASGLWATAMGLGTNASGSVSTAMGGFSKASGSTATAMGYETIASGEVATAMGNTTVASGHSSTAMGFHTIASGNQSVAMGWFTNASGPVSVAMGVDTVASGDYATSMGVSGEQLYLYFTYTYSE